MCKYYLKYSKRCKRDCCCRNNLRGRTGCCKMNNERLKAIPEETAIDCCMADSDCSHRHGCSSLLRSSAGKSSTTSSAGCDRTLGSPRDAKLRLARQLQAEEHRRRVRDLMESQRIADEVRRRQEAERRRRVEEARQRDAERRRVVEERRRRLEEADRERREALLRRLTDNVPTEDQHQHQLERRGRTGIPFAFGSCTPREICETATAAAAAAPTTARSQSAGGGGHDCRERESAHMRSHRRAVSCIVREGQSEENQLTHDNGTANKSPVSSRAESIIPKSRNVDRRHPAAAGSTGSSLEVSTGTGSVRLRRPTAAGAGGGASPSCRPASLRDSQLSAASTTSTKSSMVDATAINKRRAKAPDAVRLSQLAQPRAHVAVAEAQQSSTLKRPAKQPKSSPSAPPQQQQQQRASAQARQKSPVATLMTKSMVELPSSKKAKGVTGAVDKSTGASVPPAVMSCSTLGLPTTRPRSVRPTQLALPKAQSVAELPSLRRAAVTIAPVATVVETASEEDTTASSTSLAEACEAKRRFEEQRRLHRERLEAERRAEEERRRAEEEFRRKRAEEQRRREEAERATQEAERAALEEQREAAELAAAAEAEERKRAEEERLRLEADAVKEAREREEAALAVQLAAEEAARQERRRRLEAIMNRVKPAANAAAAFTAAGAAASATASVTASVATAGAAAAAAAAVAPTRNSPMTASMPPTVLAAELQQPQSPQSPADLAVLADRLKGTKAAEILARRSGSQNTLLTPSVSVADVSNVVAGDVADVADAQVKSRLAAVRARLRPATTFSAGEATPPSSPTPAATTTTEVAKDEDAESGVSSPQSALGDGDLMAM